jgi:hypothetical protein
MKNYSHYVIRIRKGKPNTSRVYRFIKILNKRHQKSEKVKNQIGFYKYGKYPLLNVNGKLLAKQLNKGVILNTSVKKYLLLSSSFIKKI